MLDGGETQMEKIFVKTIFAILLSVALLPFAYADCVEPYDGMIITEDVEFCGKTYDIPNGIKIEADNILVNCKTSILRGNGEGIGITLEGRSGVEIRECTVITHDIGIFLQDSIGNLIDDNGILKNRIGVRLLNSYENVIKRNNDKSFVRAVSSVNSKFNVYDYGNKNIDQDFCEDNICNEDIEISPCVDDDFYCSAKCDSSNDNDCKEAAKPKATTQQETVEEIKVEEKKVITQPRSEPLKPTRYWLYPLFYIITFFIIEFVAYVKRYDREGG